MQRVDRQVLGLALPSMVALAADPLLSLIDTALVGRLGALPLAALGINTAVFTTVFVGFNFLTYGTTANVARMRGAGDPSRAATYAVQALWIALAGGVGVSLTLLMAGPAILAAMGASGELLDTSLTYLRIRALGVLPLLITLVGHGVFRGLHDARTPLIITIIANVLNGVLSWVLIHPVGLGIAGAAIGTITAETASAAAFVVLGRPRLAGASLRIDTAAMRQVLVVSRMLFLRTVAWLTGIVLTTAVAARMGTTTVAAHQIARELWLLLSLLLDGFAIAGQAMVADALGAGNRDQAQQYATRLLRWGLGAGLLIGVVYFALSGALPGVFTGDREILLLVAGVWPIVALLQPVGGIVFVLDGILVGAGDFRFLLWSTVVASFGALVPLTLLALRFGWGLHGVWVAMSALMLVRLLANSWRMRSRRWQLVGAPAS